MITEPSPDDSTRFLKTACPLCHAPLDTLYIMLGAAVECPACYDSVIPEVLVGTSYPNTGYEISFRDFCQLLSDATSRPHVLPFLREWFSFDVPLTPGGFSIVATDGSSVSPLTVHQSIQANAQRQYSLYQTAMSLWR